MVLIRPARGTRASRTSSARSKVTREEASLSSSTWHEEASKQDFVCLEQSRGKGKHVLVRQARRNKQEGLRLPRVKSRERQTCPHPTGTRNQASGTSSARSEVARKANLFPSTQHEEASERNFICSKRNREKCKLVLICLERGSKQAGLRPTGEKSQE